LQITKEIQDSTVLHRDYQFQKELIVMQDAQFYNEHLFVLRLTLHII
jgi:hypothetical protein